MSEITKPSDLNTIWASGGDKLDPGTTKYQTGWGAELPPRQWENFVQNKQDQAIAHINQHGIPVWDNATEYQANKSYVQGSDGRIYKALTTNTNTDPVTDLGTNWEMLAITRMATATESQSLSSDSVVISPMSLKEAFQGANQLLSSSAARQDLPGGFILQTGRVDNTNAGTDIVVTFPKAFPNSLVSVQLTVTANTDTIVVFSNATASQILGVRTFTGGVRATNGFYWTAIGY